MTLALVIVGLSFLSVPGILRRPGRRIQPQLWTRLCTWSLIIGAVVTMMGEVVLSLATFFGFIGDYRVARDCELMFGQIFVANPTVSLIALTLVPLSIILGLRSLLKYRSAVRRAWVEPEIGEHTHLDNNVELVVVEDSLPRAFSVPSGRYRTSQVVLTTGLLVTLSEDQVDVVRAHERAHLDSRHGRSLATALIVKNLFWFWPPVYLATAELRLAIERSADESSVYTSRHARSILHSALLVLALGEGSPVLASFSSLAGLTHRLDAMDRDPATSGSLRSWIAVAFLLGSLSVASVLSLGHFVHGGYCLLSMLNNCAHR